MAATAPTAARTDVRRPAPPRLNPTARMALRRLALLPLLLLGVVFVVFLSVHLSPGDPARVLAGQSANPQQIAQIRAEYGFDQPLLVQFGHYLEKLSHGDLGQSLQSGRPVLDELRERLPISLELTLIASLIGIPAGLALGAWAAARRNTLVDDGTRIVGLIGLSIPAFWLGLLLAYVFSVELGWLPFGGQLPAFTQLDRITGFVTVDSLLQGRIALFADSLRYLALPALTLAVIPLAVVARFARSAFIEILSEDHIRTLRAYGVSERRLIWRYAAKNAMLPLVTVIGVLVPALLGGAVLVETTFSWPGIGTLLLNSITTRDYAVIQGVTLVFALVYIVTTLIVDIVYGMLDPRTRR